MSLGASLTEGAPRGTDRFPRSTDDLRRTRPTPISPREPYLRRVLADFEAGRLEPYDYTRRVLAINAAASTRGDGGDRRRASPTVLPAAPAPRRAAVSTRSTWPSSGRLGQSAVPYPDDRATWRWRSSS